MVWVLTNDKPPFEPYTGDRRPFRTRKRAPELG